MGITAENLAEEYGITREEQDRFALWSQEKAARAIAAGKFRDEIVPVTVRNRKGEERMVDATSIPAPIPPWRSWLSCPPPSNPTER